MSREAQYAAAGEDFRECATCAAKPGAPTLCESCIYNRRAIARLREITPADEWDVCVRECDSGFRAIIHLPRAMWKLPGVQGQATARGGWLFGEGSTHREAITNLERAIGSAVLNGRSVLAFAAAVNHGWEPKP